MKSKYFLFVIALMATSAFAREPMSHAMPRMQISSGVVGTNDTDSWRHYLLYIGKNATVEATKEASPSDALSILLISANFKSTFEQRIADFNAVQSKRTDPTDQLAASTQFIVDRNALVENYRQQLQTVLSPLSYQLLADRVGASVASLSITTQADSVQAATSCSYTYSKNMTPAVITAANYTSHNAGFIIGEIVDGCSTMNVPPQYTHTPQVRLFINNVDQGTISGQAVCTSCYAYVNGGWTKSLNFGVKMDIRDNGQVYCTLLVGLFFVSNPNPPTWEIEIAYNRIHIPTYTPGSQCYLVNNGNIHYNWWYGPGGVNGNTITGGAWQQFNNISPAFARGCYIPVDNACTGNLFDADFHSGTTRFSTFVPSDYMDAGTRTWGGYSVSGQSKYLDTLTILFKTVSDTTWRTSQQFQGSPMQFNSVMANGPWNSPVMHVLYYATDPAATANCTYQSGSTPAKISNDTKTITGH